MIKQRRHSNGVRSSSLKASRLNGQLNSPGHRMVRSLASSSSSFFASSPFLIRSVLLTCFPLLLISFLSAIALFATSSSVRHSDRHPFPIAMDSRSGASSAGTSTIATKDHVEDNDEDLLRRWTFTPRSPNNHTGGGTHQHHRTNNATVITIDDWLAGGWPPVIHIVKTRFMQEQGDLLELAKARLLLFRTFCYPTLRGQTTQYFLWIIKYDPHLDRSILSELVRLLLLPDDDDGNNNDGNDYHRAGDNRNVYLVPSNRNFRINQQYPGGWRDGAEIDELRNTVFLLGNQTRLEYAMALQDSLPVLETRLDADDGLHVDFLRSIQTMALKSLSSTTTTHGTTTRTAKMAGKDKGGVAWMYWCSRRHLEWFWDMDSALGRLEGVSHERLCVTPGMTTGFAVGTRERSVPIFGHHELIRQLENETSCGADRCLQFTDRFVFDAIRSRCPTSAGMANILANVFSGAGQHQRRQLADGGQGNEWVQYAFWNMVHESFTIARPSVAWVNEYVKNHLIDIAKDNLKGQCTSGHSCKESAKQDLETLIATLQQHTPATNRTDPSTVD